MIWKKIKTCIENCFTKEEEDRPPRSAVEDMGSVTGWRVTEPKLFYPDAERMDEGQKTLGLYRNKYPEGAVIHYTAGNGSLEGDSKFAKEAGYNYFIIDKLGKIAQLAPLDRWGYHAGKSSCPLGKSVSRFLVGIEVVCAGKLERKECEGIDGKYVTYRTWWGKAVHESDVRSFRYSSRRGQHIRSFEKFTCAQEDALQKLLLWLKNNNPKVFQFDNVFAHSEVSPGRKIDPGVSFSQTMPFYRKNLKQSRIAGHIT